MNVNINHFIKLDGKTNSMRTRESYVKKYFPELHQNTLSHISLYNIKVSRFSEAMYYYFNGITEQMKCSSGSCNNILTKFISLSVGYLNYCSSKCSNSSEKVKKAKEESTMNKYGVKNPFQAKEVKETLKNTLIERYGDDNPMRIDSIKKEMIQRKLKKEGVKWSLSKGGNAYNDKIAKEKDKFLKLLNGIELIGKYNTSKNGICKFKCNKCGKKFEASKYIIYMRRNVNQCLKCNPINSFNSTKMHEEISNFLNDLNITYECNNRKILKGKELDIYIKDYNLAIEIDGIYWHSEIHKNDDYHLNKTERCEKLGIRLIHIFEDEWLNKKEIVKSRIKSILKLSNHRIYARHCNIIELNGKETKDFLEKNHLQGYVTSSIKLGLKYNNKLVSVMTLGRLRKALGSSGSGTEFEMYRFCSILDHNITGGASKLLSYFIKKHNPTKIVSFADKRWSIGDLYKNIGFNKTSKSKPNYWYVNNGIREHRFKYRKSELIKQGFNPSKTEHEIMLERKFYRIYDCGNIKFEIKINN